MTKANHIPVEERLICFCIQYNANRFNQKVKLILVDDLAIQNGFKFSYIPEVRQIGTTHEYKPSCVHLKQTVCNLYDSDLSPLMIKLPR